MSENSLNLRKSNSPENSLNLRKLNSPENSLNLRKSNSPENSLNLGKLNSNTSPEEKDEELSSPKNSLNLGKLRLNSNSNSGENLSKATSSKGIILNNNSLEKAKESFNRELKSDKSFKKVTSDIWKTDFLEGRHRCIHKMYLTKVWSQYFKKGSTTLLRFGINNLKDEPSVDCNYFLLNVILKDYHKTNKLYNIKQYVIDGYKQIFNRKTEHNIMTKWQQEDKPFESVFNSANHLMQIESIIRSSTYRLTVIDFVIFMVSQKIPILFIYQSKKTKTSDGIKLFYMMESDYYYVIKLKNNKIFMLHMWTFRKNTKNQLSVIKFYKEVMTPKLRDKLEDIPNTSFDDYLSVNIL